MNLIERLKTAQFYLQKARKATDYKEKDNYILIAERQLKAIL